jgi:endo-1,4-beta-xylanase
LPLYPPGSPFLNTQRIREPEQYILSQSTPGRINSIVNVHNPSIEVHTVEGGLNTGAAIILIAGGGHNFLNVGSEGADFVPFFFNYGVNTVILRNRLRKDGYDVMTDATYDVEQAIRLVRAHAADWKIDPHKIGIMGFSAGAQLASNAAIFYPAFDKKNSSAADPLSGISSRPDFVALVYPGPTPFTPTPLVPGAAAPAVPQDAPPAFLICAGSDDRIHALWTDDYFRAMVNLGVPNVEMHIYGNGRHPGDPLRDGSHMSGGLSDRNGTPFGVWQFRFIDWFRDLGFLGKSGVETKAARDTEYFVHQPPAAQ